MIDTSQRMGNITMQYFAHLNTIIQQKISSGIDVIRLDIGSPDLPPPSHIIEALVQSAHSPDSHGYISHQGITELRRAWSDMYYRKYGVKIEADGEVLPLIGSKEGIFHLTQAYINPGDVVLVPDPGYLTYSNAAKFAGGEVFYMPLTRENNYLPDFETIPTNIANRAKLLWLNYPNNPTAAIASPEFLKKAYTFATKFNLLLCYDAAYTQILFDGYEAPSILQIAGVNSHVIEFNTLSKSHNMAGWRMGMIAGSSEVINNLLKLKTQMDSGYFLPIMVAATAALSGDQGWLQARNEIYQKRRNLIIDNLQRMGFDVQKPMASLYVWCPIPEGMKSVEFAEAALDMANVSLTPGTVFGTNGEGYVRITLTSPEEKIIEAMERLARWLSR